MRRLDNLQLPAQVSINRETKAGELSLKNTHHSHSVLFKIKTTKLDVFEVKPSKGIVKPNSTKIINFRLLNDKIDLQAIERSEKFMIEMVNVSDGTISREAIDKLWQEIKVKKADVSLGHELAKLHIDLGFNLVSTVNRLSTELNEEGNTTRKVHSILRSSQNSEEKPERGDYQLSSTYETLRQKEDKLLKQRQSLFKEPKKSSRKSSLLIVVFLIAFLIGNYIRAKTAFSMEN